LPVGIWTPPRFTGRGSDDIKDLHFVKFTDEVFGRNVGIFFSKIEYLAGNELLIKTIKFFAIFRIDKKG
jgi:hypothetical protein